MNEDLYRLVYISRNRMPIGPELDQGIENILEVSRTNNVAAGITGALIFNSGCFAQVLEGAQEAIEQTYERIMMDDRHENTQILFFETVSAREFECWSMAYIGADTRSLETFASIATATGFEASRFEGERLYDIMKQHMKDAETDGTGQRAA